MAGQSGSSRRPPRPAPPPPRTRSQQGRDLAPYSKPTPKSRAEMLRDTAEHAKQVRATLRGKDGRLEWHDEREKPPAQFEQDKMLVVRNWLKRRPVEPTPEAAALVKYPRLWATKRGRYCRFQAPGAGIYGLMRARPTF